MASMRAWTPPDGPGDGGELPLALVERDRPSPGPAGLLVRVSTRGVCRTDLHLAEGDLEPR